MQIKKGGRSGFGSSVFYCVKISQPINFFVILRLLRRQNALPLNGRRLFFVKIAYRIIFIRILSLLNIQNH